MTAFYRITSRVINMTAAKVNLKEGGRNVDGLSGAL
jgi:hypothetical protein